MKLYLSFLFLISLVIGSCNHSITESPSENVERSTAEPLITRDIQTGDNSQLLQSIEYTIKINKLNFSILAGLRADSTVALKFNYYHPLDFNEHLHYQKMLMDSVIKDFGAFKFRSVFLGRLIYTGDLCLKVSKEVAEANWDGKSYPDLKKILDSGIVMDIFEPVFENYGIGLSGTSFEKAFLTNGEAIGQYAKISTPEENIPSEILDAMFWLTLE